MRSFIFVHIPKTAGGTFRRILDENFDTVRDGAKPWKGQITPKVKHKPVITGHFDVDKYADLNRLMITVVRDPVERLISDYYFFAWKYAPGKDIRYWAEKTANLQHQYIKDLDRFEWVGLTERFDESLDSFEKWCGKKISREFKIYNVGKRKKPVSEGDREYIRCLNDKDYEIYNEVLKWYTG